MANLKNLTRVLLKKSLQRGMGWRARVWSKSKNLPDLGSPWTSKTSVCFRFGSLEAEKKFGRFCGTRIFEKSDRIPNSIDELFDNAWFLGYKSHQKTKNQPCLEVRIVRDVSDSLQKPRHNHVRENLVRVLRSEALESRNP